MPSRDRKDRSTRGPGAVVTADRRSPRLKDVAEAAGVHISTASRALNERTAALLNPRTLERVREAADGLGYRVNGMARALKTQRSLSIGMVVPDITNPFFPPAVRGAEDVLDEAGYSLLLSSTDNDPGKARRQVAAMLEGQVDGLLLAMARREDPLVNELRAGGTPLVLVNRTIDRGGVSAVVPDDFHGALEAVEHLYGLGHRRLAFVGGPLSTSNGARRRASFEQTVRRLGLSDTTALEVPAFDEAAGYAAAQSLFADHPDDHRGGRRKRPAGHRRHRGGRRTGPALPGRPVGGGLQRHAPGRPAPAAADHGPDPAVRRGSPGRRTAAGPGARPPPEPRDRADLGPAHRARLDRATGPAAG